MNKLFRAHYPFFDDESVLPAPAVTIPVSGVSRIFRAHYLFFDEDQIPYTLADIIAKTQEQGSGKNQQQMRDDFLMMEEEAALLFLML